MFYTVAEDRGCRESVEQNHHDTFVSALLAAKETAAPTNWVDIWEDNRFIGTWHVGVSDWSKHATTQERMLASYVRRTQDF